MCTGFFIVLNIYMSDNPQLTIQDLVDLRQCLDLASTRGAFRAEEMSSVGRTYDKLNTFLSSVLSQVETTDQTKNPEGDVDA